MPSKLQGIHFVALYQQTANSIYLCSSEYFKLTKRNQVMIAFKRKLHRRSKRQLRTIPRLFPKMKCIDIFHTILAYKFHVLFWISYFKLCKPQFATRRHIHGSNQISITTTYYNSTATQMIKASKLILLVNSLLNSNIGLRTIAISHLPNVLGS